LPTPVPIREGRYVLDGAFPPRPRVLLGNLEPLVRMGMERALEDYGCELVGDPHGSGDIVGQAGHLRPDAVVLDLDHGRTQELVLLVRSASPRSKLILWARDEDVMEVVDPGASTPRLIVDSVSDELHRELSSSTATPMEE
jgi:DNA-binding NarL/FixJ family response regulator